MVNFTYCIARSVEFISCRVGAGSFEVDPNYKCSACLAAPSITQCSECEEAWIAELSVLQYSDAFERRVNASVGAASIVMSVSAMLGNRDLRLWEEGRLVGMVNDFILNLLPGELPTSDALQRVCSYMLMLVFLLSLFVMVANMLIACFVLAMSPWSPRHWRHVGLGVYVVLGTQMAVYTICLWVGVTMAEVGFVVCPMVIGVGALGCWAFMSGETGDLEDQCSGKGSIRLGDSEELLKL